ncbi:MAG: cytochrome c3 family protein [Sphingomonadaceae bacterium]|nr:cytochrome c3 family protein [Sphingomonadaceae bacterium]
MTFLIETIDVTASGREIVRRKELPGTELGIGRDAANEIHLDDLAVELNHARVTQREDGTLAVEAVSSLGFSVEGRHTSSAIIDPRGGGEMGFGNYRLTVSQGEGGVPAISIRVAEAAEGARADKVGGFALASAMPSKRAVAWVALVGILIAFLAVPIFSHLTREKVKPDYDQPGAVLMDASWSTGSLSLAHEGLEDNCEACHVTPFEAVTDKTCLSCHGELSKRIDTVIEDHAKPDRMAPARGPLPWGDQVQWDIAHAFGKSGPGVCSDCHTEHEGKTKMLPTPQAFCADCHGSLDKRLTDTDLGNAGDFGTAHPQFKAVLFTEPGQKDPVRLSLDSQPKEYNGLRFPHDVHLDTRGGVARMARSIGAKRGYGSAGMECKDCHRLNKDESDYLPVEMERDCEACHSLVYDRSGDQFRKLEHGDVGKMQAALSRLSRAPRRPIVSDRRRPGEYARGGLYYQDFGQPQRGLIAINRALSKGGVCGDCHIPTSKGSRADLMPVNLPDKYFIRGFFDHKTHEKDAECSDCHLAGQSKSADDLLMPAIKQCRDCHMGEADKEADVPSSCAMCHAYHPRNGLMPAIDPHRKDKKTLSGKTKVASARHE